MIRKTVATVGMAFALLFSGGMSAQAVSAPPVEPVAPAAQPVLDNADVFSPDDEQAITRAFTEDAAEYGLVFVVETIESLDGAVLEEYSLERATEVLGADSTNGVYILFVNGDRVVRFELSDPVGANVSDQAVSTVIQNAVIPAFRAGDYPGGIIAGADNVGVEYLNPGTISAAAPITNSPSHSSDSSGGGVALAVLFIFLGIAVAVTVTAFIVSKIRGAKAEKARKAQEALEAIRQEFVNDTVARVLTERRDAYMMASGSAERAKVAEEFTTTYLAQDAAYAGTAFGLIESRILNPLMSKVCDEEGVSTLVSMPRELYKESVVDMLAAYRDEVEAWKREQAARRAREEAQAEEARRFWDNLSEQERAAVREARTKEDKIRVLDDYNTTNLAAISMWPVLYGTYRSEVGEPKSAVQPAPERHSSGGEFGGFSATSGTFGGFTSGGGSFGSGGGGGFSGKGSSGSW